MTLKDHVDAQLETTLFWKTNSVILFYTFLFSLFVIAKLASYCQKNSIEYITFVSISGLLLVSAFSIFLLIVFQVLFGIVNFLISRFIKN